jgi:transglutaminase/protease-like cytokinesis protein 3
MTKLGIPTYYITGDANGDHAWNLILLDDGFYNVDLTWDDQVDRIIYKYYNVNEEMITTDHTRRELSTKLVKAEGSKYINKYSTLGE